MLDEVIRHVFPWACIEGSAVESNRCATLDCVLLMPCSGDRAAVAEELAGLAKSGGIQALVSGGAVDAIQAALADAKSTNAREGGLMALAALARCAQY